MPDLFSEFLERPDKTRYLRVRSAIIGSVEYDMFSDGLSRLEELIESGDHQAVPALVPELMPNWLLSPRVHQLLSASATERGEPDRAKGEHTLAVACANAITQTGDGSMDAPYVVTHVSDEYDIAAAMDRNVTTQKRENHNGLALDILVMEDGSQLCFDVTDGLAAMASR